MAKRVVLFTTHFEEALLKYLDETKPDQLAKKQVEALICEWTEHENNKLQNDDLVPKLNSTCFVRGTLGLHGGYMTVMLQVDSQWNWKDSIGTLELTLSVRARFRSKTELRGTRKSESKDTSNDGSIATATTSATRSRADNKIRANMVKRLRQDDYVAKILNDEFLPFCQATIFQKDESELEERVWMDPDLLESIRRCIYSQADNILSVVELLTVMPYFQTPYCPLGHRAKLRLLEDAMLDACEREGEEELIDELSLSGMLTKENDGVVDKESDIGHKVPCKKTRR